ncbi:MAG: hypothetical protein WC548_02245 [Candidatus Pacearchaeota archaeon]
MRLRYLVCFFSFFFLFGIFADGQSINDSEVDNLENTIDQYIPINDDGEFDSTKYKSKAELRIAKINEYIGPITKFLWGVELSLSWTFVFSVLVWILLTGFIVMPISEVLNFNVWGSLFASFIVATLAMQGFGQDLVAWMSSISTSWEIGLVVLGFSAILGAVYLVIMKLFGKKMNKWREEKKREQEERDRAKLHVASEIAEQEYLDQDKSRRPKNI